MAKASNGGSRLTARWAVALAAGRVDGHRLGPKSSIGTTTTGSTVDVAGVRTASRMRSGWGWIRSTGIAGRSRTARPTQWLHGYDLRRPQGHDLWWRSGTAAGGTGIFALMAALNWRGATCVAPDTDGDGITDDVDRINRPEDIDGFEDEDGCPDDNDKDGIPTTTMPARTTGQKNTMAGIRR